jgi:hypothetical protein
MERDMTGSLYEAFPKPDALGRLVLKETKANIFGTFLIAIGICGFALISAAYWYELAQSDALAVELSSPQIKLVAALGLASLLGLPYCFNSILNPPSLVVDHEGVELHQPGRTQRLAWQDVQDIRTDVIRDTRTTSLNGTGTFDPYTVTVIRGQGEVIVLKQDFGVTPSALTDYLIQRQNGVFGHCIQRDNRNAAAAQRVEAGMKLRNSFRLVMFMIIVFGLVAFLGFLLWARLTLF